VTAAQRLRLVLTLGVINLVLASVALGIGITGTPGPTPGIAVVEPTPGSAGPPGASPTAPGTERTPAPPTPSSRPGGPGPEPSSEPGGGPTPSAEPSPSPAIEPSPSPVPPPSPVPETTPVPPAEPGLAAGPGQQPANPNTGGGGPAPTPEPTATPGVPVVDQPGTPRTCHASDRGIAASKGKACGTNRGEHPNKPGKHKVDQDRGDHHGPRADRHREHGHQPATVDQPRRGHSSRHRLRRGRRAR
jgi:hypothetical protein